VLWVVGKGLTGILPYFSRHPDLFIVVLVFVLIAGYRLQSRRPNSKDLPVELCKERNHSGGVEVVNNETLVSVEVVKVRNFGRNPNGFEFSVSRKNKASLMLWLARVQEAT
jgi:hypothetical protein